MNCMSYRLNNVILMNICCIMFCTNMILSALVDNQNQKQMFLEEIGRDPDVTELGVRFCEIFFSQIIFLKCELICTKSDAFLQLQF